MKRSLLFVLALALQLGAAAVAQAAWNADWPQRTKIVLNTSAQGLDLKGGAADVPVLVRLHTGNFNFLDAKPDGSDLRFIAADDKTPLKFHIEQFDAINELVLVWVQLPRINPGKADDFVWLYYGNANAAAAGDAKTSYDSAMGLVYHFREGQATPQDQTANNNHADRMTAQPTPAGLIAAGAAFDGRSELRINATPSLRAGSGGLTVSMWLKPGAVANATLWRQAEGSAAMSLALRNGQLVAQAGTLATAPAGTLRTGDWQHVALVANNGLSVFLDGVQVATVAGTTPALAGEITVGEGFQGELDELQIASTARSADWLRLAAGSQGPAQKFTNVAPAEAGEAAEGGTSYIRILLSAVTVDGWVVIAILGVMFVISFWVMISKALLVRKTGRDNEDFMDSFPELMRSVKPGQPLAEREVGEQAAEARFGDSPLYRLYAAAVHEMHSRFDAYQAQGRVLLLNENALSAIKATVDARLVREMQWLNSKLVVLTVSIAGGPFLGLLGTVVGVMITFAAIAAAGDVNVNAIAPGIAAALVATVAGLAVAIPCLFGYNFLTSRIGELAADLQAFTDEMVTRIAEDHST